MLTTVEPAASRRPLDPVFISNEVFRRSAYEAKIAADGFDGCG